ncbi:alanine/glycine:cation symporter family protein [Marinicella sp. S1101]|uniref:alanine/glycine:cation symporter family protein n=1 Tax=Marinicella marina TaxID=2996016 RepID=UPI002260DF49|nr:alanine/glycine:cation symporter family protein [Marinicella marina]MCX7554248.1 alanine/glycine:cation symporter family protein [Marinicella marina]MDJ1138759.1 alanine/glycine:cation symporter family protein [Marinicella marina]
MYKKIFLSLALFVLPLPLLAQGIDQRINDLLTPVANAVDGFFMTSIPIPFIGSAPFIVIWLVIAATFFTLYFKFINLRSFAIGMKLIRGKYDTTGAVGEVTHFQALSTAVSGTVGLGNIAGVATAVSVGGPGATFWMIVAGLIGMSTKFVECTLGVKYRDIHADGTVAGGPMKYLAKGFAEGGHVRFGKFLAFVFAILCVAASLGGGNMFQANQSFAQLQNITGGADSFLAGKGWLFGLVLAFFTGLTILGGIKSIARVTSKLVPIMGVIYVVTGLVVIFANIGNLGHAISQIIGGAFTPEAGLGGVLGVLIVGFQRAAFSNEAGVGSAAIAHSAVKTDRPVTEGLVALYEPFIDTVVVCTITALVIVITGSLETSTGVQGIPLTSDAFASVVSWFPYVLTVAAILFAFSTMISWSYYGVRAWTHLFGENKTQEHIFKVIFLVFVVIGSSINLTAVIGFSFAMTLAMSFPNIIGLYYLAPVVKQELNAFMADIKSGQLVFKP